MVERGVDSDRPDARLERPSFHIPLLTGYDCEVLIRRVELDDRRTDADSRGRYPGVDLYHTLIRCQLVDDPRNLEGHLGDSVGNR